MKALLVCGGSLTAAFLLEVRHKVSPEILIAVDGGICVMEEAGIIPTILLGDFDTASPNTVRKYEGVCKIMRHPPEKDATDSELAVEEAVRCGAEEIYLLGATGSRLDHTMANIHMLFKIGKLGKKGYLLNENNRVSLHEESFTCKRSDLIGTYLSFLPFHSDVESLSLTGVKYPLKNRFLPAGSSLCISNEVSQDEISISFTKGYLLMIEARD